MSRLADESAPITTAAPGGEASRARAAALRQRLLAIALMSAAVASFSLLDSLAKVLGQYMDPWQVVWTRYASALLFVLILFNPRRHPGVFVTKKPWLQAFRSALLFLSTALNFFAVQYLQLDQTVAIMFTTPLIVAALAGPLLGEKVGAFRLGALAIGFVGVLIVTQPWSASVHWAMGLSLAGACCYAVYSIMTRLIGEADSAETTSFYSVAFGAVVGSLIVPFFWTTPTSLWIVVVMVGLGGLGAFGHWLLILAHQKAPAAVVAPYIYSQIIWMIALGWLWFGDKPALNTLVGAAIVIACGVAMILRERRG